MTVGFCRVDGLVLESISRLSNRRESQSIPGSPDAVGARGANVMRGYGNNPKGNEHAFHERDVSHW